MGMNHASFDANNDGVHDKVTEEYGDPSCVMGIETLSPYSV